MTINAIPNSQRLNSFSRGYKWLHWIMAVLFILMLFAIIGFADDMSADDRKTMLIGHSSIGITIAILVLYRIYKRFIKRDPIPELAITPMQRFIAKSAQYALYFFMVYVPLTGFLTARLHELPVMFFGQVNLSQSSVDGYSESTFMLFRQFHEFGTRMLLLLIVLHIGGAFFHKLVKKDEVLRSITTGKE